MNKSEIEQWLKKHNITKYTIHLNLVVDVDGDVNLYDKNLESLPFQFGKVGGHFNCSYNNLTSLKYCPSTVGGYFYCYGNPFKVIPEDYAIWIEAIKVNKNVYPEIENIATSEMKACHKLFWEL